MADRQRWPCLANASQPRAMPLTRDAYATGAQRHRLQLGIQLQPFRAHFPADTRLFEPAERRAPGLGGAVGGVCDQLPIGVTDQQWNRRSAELLQAPARQRRAFRDRQFLQSHAGPAGTCDIEDLHHVGPDGQIRHPPSAGHIR
jgi:hypothetical protein